MGRPCFCWNMDLCAVLMKTNSTWGSPQQRPETCHFALIDPMLTTIFGLPTKWARRRD